MSKPTTSSYDGRTAPDDPDRGGGTAGASKASTRPRSDRPRWWWLVLGIVLAGIGAAGAHSWWDNRQAGLAWAGAEEAIARRDLSGAAEHLDRYLAHRPADPAGWFLAARTARRRGQIPEAKRYLSEFERLGGAADAVRLERDLLLVQQGVVGETDVRLHATIGPDHPDARFVLEALARGYVIAERWADARQACEFWRAIEPDAPWAWLWAGWVCERMVQTEQAAEFYRRAFELAPDDRDVRVAVGRVQLRQRNLEAAAPHFEWVLERNPDDPEALLGLAECRIVGGHVADAVPLIDRVLARDPESNLAMALRGRADLESGDPAAAERWLRQAVRAEPADAEALHLLVLGLRAQRKDQEAGDLTVRLEALRKDLKRLHELMRLIGPTLTDPGPCHEAAVIALRVGRTRQGLILIEEALRRPGDHRPIHSTLAEHYRQIGRLDLADVHRGLARKP